MTTTLRIPDPPTPIQRVALHVTTAAERNLRHGHPWLYDQGIRKQRDEGRPGDLAVVFDHENKFLAIGLYDPFSPIRVRVLQARKSAPIDRAWFQKRLAAAVRVREPLRETNTTGYRLVHGENDGLPGLVVDRYEQTLVLKLYTVAWVAHLRELVAALALVWPMKRLVLRLARTVQQRAEHLHGLEDGQLLVGPPIREPLIFQEHGLRFIVDPVRGQKTGFFLDQRENRAALERLCRGKTVLDTFAYTGAFSVYAARGGASEVTSIDVSRPALRASNENLRLNHAYRSVAAVRQHLIEGDVFDVLKRLAAQRARFDVVVLDPPAFAKTRLEVNAAMAAYEGMTKLGLEVLRPGGVLVASSCSSHVSDETFFSAMHRAARAMRRPLEELQRTGHPLDHPVGFAEGAYLKCLFAVAAG